MEVTYENSMLVYVSSVCELVWLCLGQRTRCQNSEQKVITHQLNRANLAISVKSLVFVTFVHASHSLTITKWV